MKNKSAKMMALAAVLTLTLTFGAVALAAPDGMGGGPNGGAPFGQEMSGGPNGGQMDRPDGDSDDQTPPEKPDGENDNGQPPALPDGTNDNGQPPALPDGATPGQGPEGRQGRGPEQMMSEMKEKIDALDDETQKAKLTELANDLEEAMKAEQEAREAFFKAAEEAGIMQAPPKNDSQNSSTQTDNSTETGV